MTMNYHYAIGIPTINRADLLNPSLEKYVGDHPGTLIFIIDNGQQDILHHENIVLFRQEKNLGFTASCNRLFSHIFDRGIQYANILNDDVYWGKNEPDVIRFLDENSKEPFIVSTLDWCNFMLPKGTYDAVGPFDEQNFFNYFSDNDYAYRMGLSGRNFMPSRFLDPQVFNRSMSIKKDPQLNATSFDESKRKYIKKWGGMPGSEKLKIPNVDKNGKVNEKV